MKNCCFSWQCITPASPLHNTIVKPDEYDEIDDHIKQSGDTIISPPYALIVTQTDTTIDDPLLEEVVYSKKDGKKRMSR